MTLVSHDWRGLIIIDPIKPALTHTATQLKSSETQWLCLPSFPFLLVFSNKEKT